MERFYELDDVGSPVTKKNNQLSKSQSREEHDGCSSNDSISDEEIMEASELLLTSASRNIERSDYVFSGSKHQEDACTWSMALKDVEELACLQATPYDFTSAGHLSDRKKRSRGKDKSKFSIRSYLHVEVDKNKMLSEVTYDGLEEENIIDDKSPETSVATLAGYPLRDGEELPSNLGCQDLGVAALPSVAKLLEDLQEKVAPTHGHLNFQPDAKLSKQKNVCFRPRTTSPSATRTLDDEDPLEFAGAGISSEEDEGCHTNQLSSVNVKNCQSMSGIFQEAFNNCSYFTSVSASFITSRRTGIGYNGRLQEIIQNEKDLQTKKAPFNDDSCLTAKILSRYLEAKLTVCHCLLDENIKIFEEKINNEKCPVDLDTLKRTVIFSSWMSGDVELEVGNFICIHPPWKEVLVDNGDIVILSSYFTQIIKDLPTS